MAKELPGLRFSNNDYTTNQCIYATKKAKTTALCCGSFLFLHFCRQVLGCGFANWFYYTPSLQFLQYNLKRDFFKAL